MLPSEGPRLTARRGEPVTIAVSHHKEVNMGPVRVTSRLDLSGVTHSMTWERAGVPATVLPAPVMTNAGVGVVEYTLPAASADALPRGVYDWTSTRTGGPAGLRSVSGTIALYEN